MKNTFLLFLLSVSPALAQEVRHLQGEIRSQARIDLSWLTVKLEASGSRDPAESAAVQADGTFDFRAVAEGNYTLKVLDASGNEVMTQPLTVISSNTPIEVRLPSRKDTVPTGETTSLVRLRHRPQKKALNAARRGQQFAQAGDYHRAATEYEEAVAADPVYSEALGNLGTQYVRLGRFQDAANSFQRAIALDPTTALHQSNLAVALSNLGRHEEAETWARRSVELDSSNGLGHYVLGCVLTLHDTTLPEAIKQLETASRTVPRAHAVLSQIYRATGKVNRAEDEMRQFHEAQAPPDGPSATRWSSPLRPEK